MRYAQENRGQRLHLVEELDPDTHNGHRVAVRAVCGRTPTRRGNWRMTVNLPLGNACRRCLAAAARSTGTDTPTEEK